MVGAHQLAAVAVLAQLAACAPLTVDQAERVCVDQARLAQRPRGAVELGYGSGGQVRAALDLEITSDYLAGRDPAAVFTACVQRRSGQFPQARVDRHAWLDRLTDARLCLHFTRPSLLKGTSHGPVHPAQKLQDPDRQDLAQACGR